MNGVSDTDFSIQVAVPKVIFNMVDWQSGGLKQCNLKRHIMNKDFNVAKFIIAHDVTSLEILWHDTILLI